MKTLRQLQETTRAYKEFTRLSGVTPEQRAQQMDDVSDKIEQQRRDFERDMAAQKAKMAAIKNKHQTQSHMKEKTEEQLDEALRHEIAGQVARFIGNKIDPVHGDIMHAHGKEAYRQAAYHIRNTIHHVSRAISDLHDQLHQHLKTGNPIKLKLGEDVEELDEARYSKYKQDTYVERPNMRDNYADFAHLGMNSDVPASKSEFKKNELKFELRKEPKKVKEATYQGKDVPLNKPMAGDVKKSKVYVDPDGDGKAQKVNFGDKTMSIKKDQPGRKKSFLARHNCDDKNDKTKAGYWSCRAWK
jgi:hypothetical protein